MGTTMSAEHLFESLREEQDQARARLDYVGLARARAAVIKPRPARVSRPLAFGLAGALALAAAVALLMTRAPTASEGLAFSVGAAVEPGRVGAFMVAPMSGQLPLRFSDGTLVTLAEGAGARVLSVDTHGAHIVLEKGRAVASVVHQPHSQWRVDAGPFEIAVIGTRFEVSWEPSEQAMSLQLAEGAVIVSGAFLREPMRVTAGQTLRAFCNEARAELVDQGTRQELKPGEAARVPVPASVVAEAIASAAPTAPLGARRTPATLSWQDLAAAGKYREALALVEQSGFEAECRSASGQDLLALGDAARLVGSASRAREAYAAARGKLPGGGRASYGLGLIAFDQQRDFSAAARWFETYLQQQPSGGLRGEASGRLLESLSRSGQTAKARQHAAHYLVSYPRGAHAELARQLTARAP